MKIKSYICLILLILFLFEGKKGLPAGMADQSILLISILVGILPFFKIHLHGYMHPLNSSEAFSPVSQKSDEKILNFEEEKNVNQVEKTNQTISRISLESLARNELLASRIHPLTNVSNILQSIIKTKKTRELSSMPLVFREAWASIPALNDMSSDDQNTFVLLIAQKLHGVLVDPSLYRKPIYFSNKPIDKLKKVMPPKSFYIEVVPESLSAVISFNVEKSPSTLLGKGSHKIFHSTSELNIFLLHQNDLLITEVKKAVGRPLKKHLFNRMDVLRPADIHRRVYERFKLEKRPGRISEPPLLREHISTSGELKQELIQAFYPGNLQIVASQGIYDPENGFCRVAVDYETRLLLIENVFATIDSLHRMGVIHRDIKPSNVLLREECGFLQSYVYDFDLVEEDEFFGLSEKYYYWSMDGQMGFLTPASDIVGAMLTACEVCFSESLDEDDVEHHCFKKGIMFIIYKLLVPDLHNQLIDSDMPVKIYYQDAESIIEYLEKLSLSDAYTEAQRDFAAKLKIKIFADIKLLELFCNQFSKEIIWKNYLVSSSICAVAGLNTAQYAELFTNGKNTIIAKFKKNLDIWQKDQLFQIIDDTLLQTLGFTRETFLEAEVSEIMNVLENYDYQSLEKVTTIKVVDKLSRFYKARYTLLTLTEATLTKDVDPSMYMQLTSKDPEERKLGREKWQHKFGRANDLKEEIAKIRKGYITAMENQPSCEQWPNFRTSCYESK